MIADQTCTNAPISMPPHLPASCRYATGNRDDEADSAVYFEHHSIQLLAARGDSIICTADMCKEPKFPALTQTTVAIVAYKGDKR